MRGTGVVRRRSFGRRGRQQWIVCTRYKPSSLMQQVANSLPPAPAHRCRQHQSLICRESRGPPGVLRFIGSHLMAGSEQTGWTSHAQTFHNAACRSPTRPEPGASHKLLIRFWQALGMLVQPFTRATDEIVAYISHLPHLLASCLQLSGRPERSGQLSGGGNATAPVSPQVTPACGARSSNRLRWPTAIAGFETTSPQDCPLIACLDIKLYLNAVKTTATIRQ